MSFATKLDINGKRYNILTVKYELFQETDATGRPSSVVRGGKIEVSIESTGDTTFAEAMVSNFDRLDGDIIFLKRDTDATLKKISFKEAYVTGYKETFNGGGLTSGVAASGENEPAIETITFSARELDFNGAASMINEWPEVTA